MEHPDKQFKEIEEKEVYEIFHSKAQVLYNYGKGITKLIIVTYKGITKMWNKMTGEEVEDSLFKQINISKLALPLIKGLRKERKTNNLKY